MPGYLEKIRLFAGTYVPEGWLPCDGRTIPINDARELASFLPPAYGGNDQYVKLPKLAGLVAVGAGAGPGLTPREIGTTGGSETVTPSPAQIPAHTHPVTVSTAPATTRTPGPQVTFAAVAPENRFYTDVTKPPSGEAAFSPLAIGQAGGGAAHENRMPYVAIQYIICINGEYPMQSSSP